MSSRSPRILYLCSSWPLGRTFGGQLRALQIGRALKQVGDVTVAVVSSDANDTEAERRTREEFAVLPPVCPISLPNRTTIKKLRRALDLKYLNVHGYVAPRKDAERIVSYFPEYDLVWVLNSRTPNILQHWRWPHAHLDLDDVPSTYLVGVSQTAATAGERWKAGVQRFLFRRREILFKERFTTLSVCSEEDRLYLGGGDQVHVISNGFERPAGEPPRHPMATPPWIGFMGLYTYEPNLDGVRWFLKKCWPAIRREVPGVRFRLVGKGLDGPLRPTDPDVDVLGWLGDPAEEIANWSATIIPIRFGGGTRVKIADAFSRKCPVVSTRLGAFGYDVQHGRELLVVDDNDPGAFASACISSIRDPVTANAMAERAYSAFLEKWTWDAIAPQVWAAAEDCLRRNFARSSRRSAAKHDSTQSTDTYSGSMDQFTVVIPTFNRSRLVQRAIESVFGQTLRANQIIVVDDGSTDDTREVCRKYGNAIEYVRQPNSGVSMARNNGIRLARNPWTAFLDSDDYWTPTHLEKVADAIKATSGQARFYFSNMRIPGGTKDNTLWTKIKFQFAAPHLLERDAASWMLSQRQPSALPCSVFSTEILKLSGGFDVRYRAMEDTELFCRVGIWGPVCAVNTVGGIETSDDHKKNRLTWIWNSHSEGYWEHESMLWSGLLDRFPNLTPDYQRGLHYGLAVAHWRLSRLHWRSRQFTHCVRDFLNSARAEPLFFLWLLRHRKSYGWESSVFPECRAT